MSILFIIFPALILVLLVKLYKSDDLLKNFLIFKTGSKKTKVGMTDQAVKFYKLFILIMIIFVSLILLGQIFASSFLLTSFF